jgi:hypothetical protein
MFGTRESGLHLPGGMTELSRIGLVLGLSGITQTRATHQ